ncbi:MAG: hypothetical protein KBG47_09580 [Bacteroidia bacterium]|nr:hypothetical protein [Sphingobacteriaceae bacterium]MBK7817699.1 hypothetical protein [Sphingobacteriaceae bacterium]MBP9069748.1 hypothetical protein [Bacteroidia bacterium]
MKSKLSIILLCLCQSFLFAQEKAKIDSLKKLGRDSLIKLAVYKVNESAFDPKGYDRVVVKAYKDRLVVEFALSVVLIDGSCYYHHYSVALAGSGTGGGIQGSCDEPKYHKFTGKEKKKIQFVFDAINKSDEIGHLKDNKIDDGNTMTITEKLTSYYVEMDDWSTHSYYEVNKISGKISNANHKHYARNHDEKPEYEIIK